MEKLYVGDTAPDFSLPDHTNNLVMLSEITRSRYGVLVFNIGFA